MSIELREEIIKKIKAMEVSVLSEKDKKYMQDLSGFYIIATSYKKNHNHIQKIEF